MQHEVLTFCFLLGTNLQSMCVAFLVVYFYMLVSSALCVARSNLLCRRVWFGGKGYASNYLRGYCLEIMVDQNEVIC